MRDNPKALTIESEDEFSGFLKRLQDKLELKEYAVILKPDEIVCTTSEHVDLNAAQNLACILSETLRFKVLLLELHKLDIKTIGVLAAEQLTEFELPTSGPIDSLAKFLRMFGAIFGEGGRQSIYDSNSFKTSISRDDFIALLRALGRERSAANTAPGVYICLSHQGMAEAQLENIKSVIEHADELEEYIREHLDPKLADQFGRRMDQIITCGENLEAVDVFGELIAKGLYDERIMVHKNERREEAGDISLHLYSPSSHVSRLPHEIYDMYEEAAGRYSGLVEDVIHSRNISVSMLHDDEVEETTVLYLNWAFQELWPICRKVVREVNLRPELDVPSILENDLLLLPVGMEITSSTYFSGLGEVPPAGDILTAVASAAVYYYEHETGLIRRDLTFQFHPEVGKGLQTISRGDMQKTYIPELEDGIKLLIAAVYTGNMPVGYCRP